MNRKRNVLMVWGILVLSFLMSIMISLFSLNIVIDDNRENMANTYSSEFCNEISALIGEPKAIAKSINHHNVREILTNKEEYDDERKETEVIIYLGELVNSFGYKTAYIVDINDRKSYSQNGSVSATDDFITEVDEWCRHFIGIGKEYYFDVKNELNTIYINYIIKDKNDNPIGVCGVGIYIDTVNQIIDNYEQRYNIDCKIVSDDGIYEFSRDSKLINQPVEDEIMRFIKAADTNQLLIYNENSNIIRNIDDFGWYLVMDISQSKLNGYDKLVLRNVIACLIVLTFVLVIFHLVVDKVYEHSRRIEASEEEQRNIVKSLSGIYYSMYLFDFKKGTCTEISSNNLIHKMYKENQSIDIQANIHTVIRKTIRAEHLNSMLEFTDLSTLPNRMKGKKILSQEFIGRLFGWSRASFIVVSEDSQGYADKVLYVTQVIEDDKKREEQLIKMSKTDELTRVYNRRAYEEDIQELQTNNKMKDLVVISIDVNGLKRANDTLGHAAGDEMIKSAAYCMVLAFSSYGKVYRTGGDEFMTLLHCTEDELQSVLTSFDKSISQWSGEKVKSLAIAKGVVVCNQYPKLSMQEIEKIADQLMYKDKSDYYKNSGIDRRKR
ncbi:MAG: diguanylate cyclase [Lachnospiraceae bacterium]|nr:diguanylate cyclase [Lachnospiraceae bacterium]